MKYKLTIVIVVTICLIALSIGETIYISKTFDELEKRLEEQMYQEEYSLVEVKELSDWWDKKAEILEIFISVIQLNEITVTLGELTGAVMKEDYESASALFDRIYQYSVRISEMYKIKIGNIL